jgi:hypothetical protein
MPPTEWAVAVGSSALLGETMKLSYILFAVLGVNIAWVIIGAIRDCKKTDKSDVHARIDRNLKIAARNIKCAAINVVIAIVVMVCGEIFHIRF